MSASSALPPMPAMPEKAAAPVPSPSVLAPYIDAVHSLVHPVSGPIMNTANSFHGWKENMGLVQPGTVENLTKEINQVHLANWFFEGARADVAKVVSANPAFQLTHSFSLGAQGAGKYNFGAIFANASTFLQGGVDGSGQVTMRANQTWSPSNITKLQGQLTSEPGRSMIQIEHDYLAPHFSFNWKSMNPGLLDGTGIHIASLIHSVTPRVSVGVETIFQRQQPSVTEIMSSYLLKITSLPSAVSAAAAISPAGVPAAPAFNPSWIATAQLQPTGNVQATYYQKLSDKVDVALDLTTNFSPAMPMMGQPGKREATATFGAKYDFRMATFRGQVDSQGKVGMLLEQRFTPAFAFLVGGEIDHAKGASRFGVGIMIESSSMTQEEMIAAGMLQPV